MVVTVSICVHIENECSNDLSEIFISDLFHISIIISLELAQTSFVQCKPIILNYLFSKCD